MNAHVRVDMFLGAAIGIIDWSVRLVRYVRWENFSVTILLRPTSPKSPRQSIDLCPSLITITREVRDKCKAGQLSDKEVEPWATPTLDGCFQTGIPDS